jgi:hypothetical protein
MKSILETEDTGFIGGIEVGLKNHYSEGHVSAAASGHNLIFSGFVRVS